MIEDENEKGWNYNRKKLDLNMEDENVIVIDQAKEIEQILEEREKEIPKHCEYYLDLIISAFKLSPTERELFFFECGIGEKPQKSEIAIKKAKKVLLTKGLLIKLAYGITMPNEKIWDYKCLLSKEIGIIISEDKIERTLDGYKRIIYSFK